MPVFNGLSIIQSWEVDPEHKDNFLHRLIFSSRRSRPQMDGKFKSAYIFQHWQIWQRWPVSDRKLISLS